MTDISHNGFDIALWYICSDDFRPRVPDHMMLLDGATHPRMGYRFWFLNFTYLGLDDQKQPVVLKTGYSCNVDAVLEYDTPDLATYCPKIGMNGALETLITADNYLKHHTDYDTAKLVKLKQVTTDIGNSWSLSYHCADSRDLSQIELCIDVESLVIFHEDITSLIVDFGESC